jgi:ankyrin repeat protein
VLPLHVACARGDAEVVEVLCRKTKLVNQVDVLRGETGLIAACRTGNWHIVPMLSSADVCVADLGGRK